MGGPADGIHTDEIDTEKRDAQFAFYIDLLGHDMLNDNQAVLSYLELVLSVPDLDEHAEKYAKKAVSHIRTSTLLIENVKRLLAMRTTDPNSFRSVDLVKTIEQARNELVKFFPGKRIDLSLSRKGVRDAYVLGDGFAQDLILNVLASAVKFDTGDDIAMNIAVGDAECAGGRCWSVRIEDGNAQFPTVLRDEKLESIYSQDSSKAVKMCGLLFADMVAGALGGGLKVEDLAVKGKGHGTAFTVYLRKAGAP